MESIVKRTPQLKADTFILSELNGRSIGAHASFSYTTSIQGAKYVMPDSGDIYILSPWAGQARLALTNSYIDGGYIKITIQNTGTAASTIEYGVRLICFYVE